jgi:hypothetical protein
MPNAAIPLTSARLAQYAQGIPCYICGESNHSDVDFCRHCQAPMALAQQARIQKQSPKLIAAIGSSGAGKTVYLGMLADILSRQHRGVQMLARGAFSISLQQATVGALAHGEFPQKTPNEPDRWNWVHCEVHRTVRRAEQVRPTELIMPDLAGEALMEEIDRPNTFPVVRSFLSKCAGVFVLIDAGAAAREKDEDFFTMKIISYLCELTADPKRGWPNRPVAIVFTKADECESCFDDPAAFAKRFTPGIWRLSQERLKRCTYFAASVVGACGWRSETYGRIHVPLRIEPRGVAEPFLWLLDAVGKA